MNMDERVWAASVMATMGGKKPPLRIEFAKPQQQPQPKQIEEAVRIFLPQEAIPVGDETLVTVAAKDETPLSPPPALTL